jgi:hypothetical protein
MPEMTIEQRREAAVHKAIALAGIPASDVTPEIVELARRACRQHSYLDEAARWMVEAIRGPHA